jgi:hypothetical protein
MIASVNKWLSFSLVGYFFSAMVSSVPAGISITLRQPAEAGGLHPLHVSTTEINHNSTDKTLEISIKIFIDDFESCLSKQYHTKADLSADNVKSKMDTLVKKYISTHLQIKADDKVTLMNYLGFEKEEEVVNIYFEVEKISSVKKIEVNDIILHDLYDDQISIIHVVVGGNRKSTKLDFPNKAALFNF